MPKLPYPPPTIFCVNPAGGIDAVCKLCDDAVVVVGFTNTEADREAIKDHHLRHYEWNISVDMGGGMLLVGRVGEQETALNFVLSEYASTDFAVTPVFISPAARASKSMAIGPVFEKPDQQDGGA